MTESRAMAQPHADRGTPDLTPQAFAFDAVLEGICRGSESLYGTKFHRDDWPFIFISSPEPGPGLELVASRDIRPGLPRLLARGSGWVLRLSEGPLVMVTRVRNP